jgi:tetratricopeptide (TPR) repeat protein
MRSLGERTQRFFSKGEAAAVLEQSARDEAVRLYLTVEPAEQFDVDAHAVGGFFYWCRYHAGREGADPTDLAIALAVYSMLVQEQRPDAVPEPILQNIWRQLGQHLTSSPGTERAGAVNDLALGMLENNALSQAADQLDAAIDMLRLALQATPDGFIRARILSNLASALVSRYEQAGKAADLEEAIALSRTAVESAVGAGETCVGMLATLANALRVWFEHTGKSADLENAVAANTAAVALTPSTHAGFATRQTNLAAALQRRFESRHNRADLDAAVRAGRCAVRSTTTPGPERADMCNNLAVSLASLFRLDGDDTTLDEAINLFREAAGLSIGRRAEFLTNLSTAYRTRYEKRPDPADLKAADSASRAAADAER